MTKLMRLAIRGLMAEISPVLDASAIMRRHAIVALAEGFPDRAEVILPQLIKTNRHWAGTAEAFLSRARRQAKKSSDQAQ